MRKTTKQNKKLVSKTLVAEVVGCEVSTVRKVLSRKRNHETLTGQHIEKANDFLNDGLNKLVEEAKKLVKF